MPCLTDVTHDLIGFPRLVVKKEDVTHLVYAIPNLHSGFMNAKEIWNSLSPLKYNWLISLAIEESPLGDGSPVAKEKKKSRCMRLMQKKK
jgi:hypothetical protein